MSRPRPTHRRVLNGWPNRRFELLRTRLCDLQVTLEESAYAPVIERLTAQLARRRLTWVPEVYLSTGWHCPDRVPIIGVPFSLATRELRRLEKEVTDVLEDRAEMLRLLRHEVGHAYNYRLRLHETREWREIFGAFSRPYREQYRSNPRSRSYVIHLGSHYAQKHPDEDFAETFAVWCTPRARWRREYEGWPTALRKLEYVDRVMSELAGRELAPVHGAPLEPIERMRLTVARYYQRQGYRMEEYGFADEVVAYFDEDLREVFRGPRNGVSPSAAGVLRRLRRRIVDRVVEVLGVRPATAESLYDKYVQRSKELGIRAPKAEESNLLVSVSAMLTGHLLTAQHTGRFTPQRRVLRRR